MIFRWENKVEGARPCPFCGCKTIKTDKPEWVKEYHVRGVQISCDNCMANVFSYSDTDDYQTSFNKALEKWNGRYYELRIVGREYRPDDPGNYEA